MPFKVGGRFLSRTKVPGNSVTVQDTRGASTTLKLKYLGIENHDLVGKSHAYEVTQVIKAPKKGHLRLVKG